MLLYALKDTTHLMLFIFANIFTGWKFMRETNFEMRALRQSPNFLALDGTVSIIESALEPIHGGQMKVTIATKPQYVPKSKWYRMTGWNGFTAFLANRVHFDIIDDAYKFVPIDGQYSGAKEGAYLYLGSLDKGRPVKMLDAHLAANLDWAISTLSKVKDIYEGAKAQSAADAKEGNKRIVDNLHKIIPTINQILQSSRNGVNPLQPTGQQRP